MSYDIAVIGAGSWGSALSIALARRAKVLLWDRDPELVASITANRENNKYLPGIAFPEQITLTANLEEALQNKELLLALPSKAITDFISQNKPLIGDQHRLCLACKGLSAGSQFLHEVIAKQLGPNAIAFIAGPSFAKEVANNLPTAITIASQDAAYRNFLANLLHGGLLRVYESSDIIGAQLGGVVKNVLAVACGISDGLQLGANARSALITRGITEMLRLGQALGAKAETLIGLAGLGDVVLTCTDNQSRNRRFGMLLASGLTTEAAIRQIGQVVEAALNVVQLMSLADRLAIEVPIIKQVFRIVQGELQPQQAVTELFARAPKQEGMANFFEIGYP